MAEKGSILLEGTFLVERAARAGMSIESISCVPAREAWCRALGTGRDPTVLRESELSAMIGYPFHRGVFASARRPPERGLAEVIEAAIVDAVSNRPTLLIAPEIIDPENLGSSFRNAAALGCSAILLGPGGPDPFSRRVLRVSMGASLCLPWARLQNPQELHYLKSRGFVIAASVLEKEAVELRAWQRPERLALLIGNEAFGVSPPWLEACDARLTIPMDGGIDSLNVATAAALFLYILGKCPVEGDSSNPD
jgi:tRNA G18 (ribose-2'-O)-methylase SpoU